MSAPKNYSVKSLTKADEPDVEKMMQRFSHLPEKKARKIAREHIALRKFQQAIYNAQPQIDIFD